MCIAVLERGHRFRHQLCHTELHLSGCRAFLPWRCPLSHNSSSGSLCAILNSSNVNDRCSYMCKTNIQGCRLKSIHAEICECWGSSKPGDSAPTYDPCFFRRKREGSTCKCRKSVEKIFLRISIMTMSSPQIKSIVYLYISLQLRRVVGLCGRHELSLKCMQMWGKVK